MAGSPPFQLAGKSENPLHFSAGENVVHFVDSVFSVTTLILCNVLHGTPKDVQNVFDVLKKTNRMSTILGGHYVET